MKNSFIIVALLVLIAAASILYVSRYQIIVNSPIIVKLNRLTGEAWVANNGVWMDIEHAAAK